MRVRELENREDFAAVLAATLEVGWTEQLGHEVRVRRGSIGAGQIWRVQPLLSTVFARGPSAAVRHFAADPFRFTPVRWRSGPQYLLGTILGTALGLRGLSRVLLKVEPPVPGAEDLLVLPGNRRIRLFDLRSGLCRVLPKVGYSRDSMRTEVGIRAHARGPFVPIAAWDREWRWFEEPIVKGCALPRVPEKNVRARLERAAIIELREWTRRTSRSERASDRVAALLRELGDALPVLEARHGQPLATEWAITARALASIAEGCGEIQTAEVHGDFQLGNVLVEEGTGQVLLTDWEYSSRRFHLYDVLVLGLGTRYERGLRGRLARFLSHGELRASCGDVDEVRDPARRRCVLAMALLEELHWASTDFQSSPKRHLDGAARALAAESGRIARALGAR